MKSSSSCCSRGSSPREPLRRERSRSSPTLIPCTSAEALCMGRQKLRTHPRLQIAHETVHVIRRAAKFKEQQREDHDLNNQGNRRDDAEHFEPELHTRPSRLTRRRNPVPVLQPCRALRPSIRADTLRVRLPRQRIWNPSCARQLPCRARSIRRRAPAVPALCAARNLCPHRPFLKENRVSPRLFLARIGCPQGHQLPAPRGNKSPWILHCPP